MTEVKTIKRHSYGGRVRMQGEVYFCDNQKHARLLEAVKKVVVVSRSTKPAQVVAKVPSIVTKKKAPECDEKGVLFDERLCDSRKKFYAYGAKQGQWKKKKGVPEEEYDAWYLMQSAVRNPANDD